MPRGILGSPPTVRVLLALLAGLPSQSLAQGSFVPFESSPVKPLLVHGDRLLVLHPTEARLVVHDLRSGTIEREIPVGLEPVSVRPRPGSSEVWVVSALADGITVVDLERGLAVATIRVGDEPADVAFSSDGARAFVTLGGRDKLVVISARERRQLARIDLPSASPRTVTLHPDGRHVLVSFFRSGNRTTIVPFDSPGAPPADPRVGVIVADTDPWSPIRLPDLDVVALRTDDLTIDASVTRVGTTIFGHAVDPATGELWVTNTEALNLRRHLPELRGRFIENRITRVSRRDGITTVTPIDLNRHVDPSGDPDPVARELSLAQPTDIVCHEGKVYVAAYGSAKIGVLDGEGNVVARIEVGEGPRGLAIHPSTSRLYCLNRLDHTVSEIDLATHRVLRTFAASSYDPVPAVLRRGLAVLGNARLSGNGTSSCASCHIDGDRDGLAWDLGDPDGDPVPSPDPEIVYSPLKGPMVTQSLRGLRGTGELHWRGDRGSVLDFAEAFMSLMGSDTRPTLEQMADLEEMILALRHPPNPNLGRERVLTNPAQRGLDHYLNGDSYNACIQCHFLPAGTKIPFSPIRESVNQTQNFKPAKLRGIYGKFDRYRKTGFGFGNEGAFGSIVELLARPRAIGAPDLPLHFRHDLSDLLREFDTGTAPVVGTEIVLDAAAAADEEVVARLEFLAEETTRAHCDVIARGLLGAGPRALLYDPSLSSFRLDDRLLGTVPLATLVNEARRGRALLLVQAVPAGSGRRLSIDRDDDLLPDGEEIRRGTSPLTSDTDGDGFRDGWETHEGTDPLDPESIPEEPRRPRILSAPELVSTLPFGELLLRLRVRAEGVLPGARLHAASTLGATLSLGLVLTGRNEWTGFDEIPRETFESGLPGWRFVIENPTGGRSRPLEVK